MSEHIIRGLFSAVASGATLYMAAEYVNLFVRTRKPWALAISAVCAGLAVSEAWKVGTRVESILELNHGS